MLKKLKIYWYITFFSILINSASAKAELQDFTLGFATGYGYDFTHRHLSAADLHLTFIFRWGHCISIDFSHYYYNNNFLLSYKIVYGYSIGEAIASIDIGTGIFYDYAIRYLRPNFIFGLDFIAGASAELTDFYINDKKHRAFLIYPYTYYEFILPNRHIICVGIRIKYAWLFAPW
jgi:hypothetical protein